MIGAYIWATVIALTGIGLGAGMWWLSGMLAGLGGQIEGRD